MTEKPFGGGSNLHDLPRPRWKSSTKGPGLTSDLSEASDTELVERVKAHQSDAAGALFQRYEKYVERALVRRMGACPDVPDLIQETFLRSIRGIEHIQRTDKLGPWFARVATFTALDFLRSKKRGSWLDLRAEESLDVAAHSPDPTLLEGVDAILSAMPPSERKAILLRHTLGLEQSELAEALDCSIATAKRRLRRAEKRFENLVRKDSGLAFAKGRTQEVP